MSQNKILQRFFDGGDLIVVALRSDPSRTGVIQQITVDGPREDLYAVHVLWHERDRVPSVHRLGTLTIVENHE